MLAIVTPVARNVLGTRTGASVTSLPPLSATRRAWPLRKNVSWLNAWAQRVFFTPLPSLSTAHRMSALSLASVTGLPSFVPRTNEESRMFGSGW